MSEPAKSPNWSLRDLKGTREEIIEQVNGSAFIPDSGKSLLIGEVSRFDPKAKYLRLDCHSQSFASPHGARYSLSLSLASL